MWKEKKSEMHCHDVLRVICGGSRNTFTVGNGHHPGVTPGTWEEPGNRCLVRMLGTGGWSAVPGKSQVTGRVWCGVAGQGPLRLIHGGDLVLFCAAPAFRSGQTRPQGPEFRSRRRYAGHGGGLSGAVTADASPVCAPGEQAAAARFLTAFGLSGLCVFADGRELRARIPAGSGAARRIPAGSWAARRSRARWRRTG
jgi:hypothetical protein